jgi:hypothetical protein
MYGRLRLIIRNDGYVNATELCTQGNVEYGKWRRRPRTREYIAFLVQNLGIKLQDLIEHMYFEDTNNPGDTVVSGTYIHSDLVCMIAQWISPEFSSMASDIVWNHITNQSLAGGNA